MPWYSECPRCREAFDPAVPAPETAKPPPTIIDAAPTPPGGHGNQFRLSRSRGQTLRHYLPRAAAGTLSVMVFCLTGTLAALDGDHGPSTALAFEQTGSTPDARLASAGRFDAL